MMMMSTSSGDGGGNNNNNYYSNSSRWRDSGIIMLNDNGDDEMKSLVYETSAAAHGCQEDDDYNHHDDDDDHHHHKNGGGIKHHHHHHKINNHNEYELDPASKQKRYASTILKRWNNSCFGSGCGGSWSMIMFTIIMMIFIMYTTMTRKDASYGSDQQWSLPSTWILRNNTNKNTNTITSSTSTTQLPVVVGTSVQQEEEDVVDVVQQHEKDDHVEDEDDEDKDNNDPGDGKNEEEVVVVVDEDEDGGGGGDDGKLITEEEQQQEDDDSNDDDNEKEKNDDDASHDDDDEKENSTAVAANDAVVVVDVDDGSSSSSSGGENMMERIEKEEDDDDDDDKKNEEAEEEEITSKDNKKNDEEEITDTNTTEEKQEKEEEKDNEEEKRKQKDDGQEEEEETVTTMTTANDEKDDHIAEPEMEEEEDETEEGESQSDDREDDDNNSKPIVDDTGTTVAAEEKDMEVEKDNSTASEKEEEKTIMASTGDDEAEEEEKKDKKEVNNDEETSTDETSSSLSSTNATAATTTTTTALVRTTTTTQAVVTVTDDNIPKGFKRSPSQLSTSYIPRSKKIRHPEKYKGELQNIISRWGQWTFIDELANQRPIIQYEKYMNRDIPNNEFPEGSWQTDKEYLLKFLPESIKHIERALEGILREYGHSKYDEPNKSFDERSFMFNMTIIGKNYPQNKCDVKHPIGNGGCINEQAIHDIRRSLLHSIITEDQFLVVMGGHSSAAGHGNHFQQSYTLQIQKILEPVLARLGIYHRSHNIGMGGLGTIQNSLGAADIYGKDIDLLIWDSAMTENDKGSIDIFMRQGLLSGNRVPVIFTTKDITAAGYSTTANIGVGVTSYWGVCYGGIKPHEEFDGDGNNDIVEMEKLPWASQYIDCPKSMNSLCRQIAYNTTCWINRTHSSSDDDTADAIIAGEYDVVDSVLSYDGYIPSIKQEKYVSGRASWHPGWRVHQLRGRNIAFNILKQLHYVLMEWNNDLIHNINNNNNQESNDFVLLPNENKWHVSKRYEDVRNAVLKHTGSPCYDFFNLPTKLCEVSIQSRTEFTPRNNPYQTSIRSIMKQHGDNDDSSSDSSSSSSTSSSSSSFEDIIPKMKPNCYDPPDVYNPRINDVPDNAIDLLTVLETGTIPFTSNKQRTKYVQSLPTSFNKQTTLWNLQQQHQQDDDDDDEQQPQKNKMLFQSNNYIEPGVGWGISNPIGNQDNCNGSYDAFCNHDCDTQHCQLSGHNDNRGALLFDSYSGWLVLNLQAVKYGIIMIKLDDWVGENANPRTKNFKCENNINCDEKKQEEEEEQEDKILQEDTKAPEQRSLLRTRTNTIEDKKKKAEESNVSQRTRNDHRELKWKNPPKGLACDDYIFEYAINGAITSWNSTEFQQQKKQLQRVVAVWVLSNSTNDYPSHNNPPTDDDDDENENEHVEDVELAIRLTGSCDRKVTFQLSHVYWA